jgi:malate/lactate dehydrogenase
MTVRVVVAGAGGGVGASLVFNLLLSALACEVVMVDGRENMVLSHLWDLEQVLEQVPADRLGTVRAGDLDDIEGADVLVVTAAAPLTVNTSRMVYLNDNGAILAPLLDRVAGGWPGTAIVVTNPVDPLCTWAHRRTGLPRERLLGYTLNDSLRLRTGIGHELDLPPGRVEAWALGEHGDLAVPLWDRVTVDGAKVRLDEAQRGAVTDFVGGWYVRHVALDSGRSSTWTSGLGISRMIAACLDGDAGQLWPASVMLEGEYGVDGVSLSVPVRLGGGGVRRIEQWDLSAREEEALRAGAQFVREAAEALV